MASSLFSGQNPTPNNTMQTLMEAARAGKRPQDVLPQLAKQDPAVINTSTSPKTDTISHQKQLNKPTENLTPSSPKD